MQRKLKSAPSFVGEKSHLKWMQRFDDLMKIEIKEVIDKDLRPKKEGLSMGEVIVSINKYTKGDAVIVTDVGQHQMKLFADTLNLFVQKVM